MPDEKYEETPRPPALRIVSLLPSITEVLCELGLSDQIVGITHECDHPPELISSGSRRARVVTTSNIDPRTLTQAEIHEAVCGSLKNGQSLYGIDRDVLRSVRPDVIFTQSLCDVCAVSYPVVLDTCAKLLGGGPAFGSTATAVGNVSEDSFGSGSALNPKVISMEPENLADCLKTFHVAAMALSQPGLRTKAENVTSSIQQGLNSIREAVKGRPKPRVAFIEWHDPIFCGGHWIVDMVGIAGGEYAMPIESGGRSAAMSNGDFIELDPDIILIGPCGFSLDRTVKDTITTFGTKDWWRSMPAVKEGRVFALDGNSYYARPGPRLLQGTAIMAACMHGKEVTDMLPKDLVPPSGYCQITHDMYDHALSMKYVGDILAATPAISACKLRPHPRCCLFVAWNGVIVLVYSGFPPPLALAKQRIDTLMPELKGEKFGSKWPKTTLAAVNDDAADLTLDQLEILRRICGEFSLKIVAADVQINVERLSAVEYECRGLEKLRKRTDIALEDVGNDPIAPASCQEKFRVDSVVEEWSDLAMYLPKVNAPGSRIGSYRESSNGATCVAFLNPLPDELIQHLADFRVAIDKEFPGRHNWLDDPSLHCTLRSLDLKKHEF